jgi:hypothetical protein
MLEEKYGNEAKVIENREEKQEEKENRKRN